MMGVRTQEVALGLVKSADKQNQVAVVFRARECFVVVVGVSSVNDGIFSWATASELSSAKAGSQEVLHVT